MKHSPIFLFIFLCIFEDGFSSTLKNRGNIPIGLEKYKTKRKGFISTNLSKFYVSNELSRFKDETFMMPLLKISMPVYALKMLLQICLSALNAFCWALPLRNKHFSQNTQLLSLANSFAGGVFLMLGFGHMIPHSIATLESIKLDSSLAFTFTLVGYLVVFFIEKIAFDSHSLLHSAGGHVHGHNHPHGQHSEASSYIQDHTHSHCHEHNSELQPCQDTSCTNHGPVSEALTVKPTLSAKSAIILLTAMSLHSFFESMALGLASDSAAAVMMATSIGLHQPAESIALLVSFLKTPFSTATIVKCLAAYSLVGPLGVAAGVMIKRMASPMVDALVVAMTAGTFLYLGATEIVSEEFDDVGPKEKWARFGSLLAGIGTIWGVSQLTDDCDSHSHGHHDHNDH